MKYVKENGYPIEIKYYQQVKDSRCPNEYTEIRKERFLYLIIVWVMNSKTGNINDEKEKLIMSLQYAYCRISTKDQNIERQIIAVKQFAPEISDNNIFIDKKTGKVFEREQYQEMKVILEHISKANLENETVELIIEELDRLGRNSDGIKKELMWYKEHGIIVRILEIPTTLIEIDENNRWVMEMVTNLLIEVYAQLAQAELEKRAKRQAEGIAVAKSKGIYKGRKPIEINSEQLGAVYSQWKSHEITAKQAMTKLNLKPNTFYRRIKEYETQISNSESTPIVK